MPLDLGVAEKYFYTFPAKSPARKIETSTILVLSVTYLMLLLEIRLDKQTSPAQDDDKQKGPSIKISGCCSAFSINWNDSSLCIPES